MLPTPLPRISILLPAFQAGSTLAAALRSIERQTEPRFECVVVDDGSSDATAEIVRAFARRDTRFRLLARPHLGLVAALNAGIDHCRGPYVARMDADDLMHRRRLEEQLERLERCPELDGLGCHVRLFPRGQVGPGYRAYERWLNGIDGETALVRELYVECPLAHPTLMLRRRALLDLRYRDRGWPEDYDLILRLVTSGRRIGVLARRRHCWRLGSERLSRNDAAYAPDRFTAVKAAFLTETFLAGCERYVLWGYGGTGRALRRALAALGRLPSHIIEVHPGRLGTRIHGAAVLPPSRLPELVGRPVVVSVAGETARRQIREAMMAMGFCETRDFVCAA